MSEIKLPPMPAAFSDPRPHYWTHTDKEMKDYATAAIKLDRQGRGEPVELRGVPEALAEGEGFWLSCTGCHESNEGYPTGPWSDTLKCHLGGGCNECGGIGAVWDDTDYAAMANEMAADMGQKVSAPQPTEPVVKESLTVAEPVKEGVLLKEFITAAGRDGVERLGLAHIYAESVKAPTLYIQSNHITCAQRMGPFMARVSGRKEQSDWVPLYASPMSDKPTCGAQNAECERQRPATQERQP